jgi:NADP-dependent 3-hydroxy acid dehydrogenase YdfG
MDINNAVVLVTGASSGIGAATALSASRAGAKVVLLARREDRLRQLAEELGEALPVRCDVTDAAQIATAVQAAMDRFGRIDVLVNNAGQGAASAIAEIDPKGFRALLNLNVVAPLLMMQAVLPFMRQQGAGSIVNVSSGIISGALPESGAYASSKAALAQLSAVARTELASVGVVVSTIYPFITATEFLKSLQTGHDKASQLEASHAPQPDKPERVAEAILDLIRTGAERADLVPEKFGGARKD